MDTECTQDILDEARAAKLALVDPIEGAEDTLRLNIKDDTRTVTGARLTKLQRRRALIEDVIAKAEALSVAIGNLLTDGYPAIPVEATDPTVYEDLANQRRSQNAFFALFSPPSLTTQVEAVISEKRPTPT